MAAEPDDAAGFFWMTELVCIGTAAVLLLTGKGGGLPLGFCIHMFIPILLDPDVPLLGTSI